MDNNDSEGSIISRRSILRMLTEREEVPWCDIRFKSKAQHHQLFDTCARRIMANLGAINLFNKLGIRKALSHTKTIYVDKK